MDKLETRLEQLLLHKSYENLTIEEIKYVHSQITIKEYETFQNILLETKECFDEKVFDSTPNLSKEVFSIFQKRRQQHQPLLSFFRRVTSYQIPAWQAVLGMGCMALLLFFSTNKKEVLTVPEKIFVHKVDTVYKSVPVNLVETKKVERSIVVPPKRFKKPKSQKKNLKNKIISSPQPQINASPTDYHNNSIVKKGRQNFIDLEIPIVGVLSDSIVRPQSKGRSVKKDPALMDFLVKVY